MPSYAKFDIWQNTAGIIRQTILQVVTVVKTDTFATTSTTPVDISGLSANITLSSNTNKVLITGTLYAGTDNPYSGAWLFGGLLARNGTAISRHDVASNRGRLFWGTQAPGNTDETIAFPINFLDSPTSTSQLTYSLQAQAESPRTVWINRGAETDGDVSISARFVSTLILMEVAS
ncbi:MAG: hypothetical protein EBT26_05280 [Microbacteriaceae bacterium]|nr:hypothetical protein [Microbacteriaceae bacterium]NBS61438.1 hypothetical protein [Microbacteriaceae bacterium]